MLLIHAKSASGCFLLSHTAHADSVGDYGEFATSFRPSRYFLLALWLKAPPKSRDLCQASGKSNFRSRRIRSTFDTPNESRRRRDYNALSDSVRIVFFSGERATALLIRG